MAAGGCAAPDLFSAYEALHPETKNGENQHTRVRQVGEGSAADRFTADTAAKLADASFTFRFLNYAADHLWPRGLWIELLPFGIDPREKVGL